MHTKNKWFGNRGFGALIAVLLIASGTLSFSLVSISSALLYADSVNTREYRIQARLNASACLDMATLMVAKDYFLNGTTTIAKLGCDISVANDFVGNIFLNVVVDFLGVTARDTRRLQVDDKGVVTIQ